MTEFYMRNLTLKDRATISDLIEALTKFPQDLLVITKGYEGGFKEIKSLESQEILLDINDAWYYGPHDSVDSVTETEANQYEKVTALLIK